MIYDTRGKIAQNINLSLDYNPSQGLSPMNLCSVESYAINNEIKTLTLSPWSLGGWPRIDNHDNVNFRKPGFPTKTDNIFQGSWYTEIWHSRSSLCVFRHLNQIRHLKIFLGIFKYLQTNWNCNRKI